MSNMMNNYMKGCISGMSGIMISHPIDTIKTHYQLNSKPFNYIINPYTLTSGQDSFSLNNPSQKELKDEISAMRNEELDNDDISGRWSKILVTLK